MTIKRMTVTIITTLYLRSPFIEFSIFTLKRRSFSITAMNRNDIVNERPLFVYWSLPCNFLISSPTLVHYCVFERKKQPNRYFRHEVECNTKMLRQSSQVRTFLSSSQLIYIHYELYSYEYVYYHMRNFVLELIGLLG